MCLCCASRSQFKGCPTQDLISPASLRTVRTSAMSGGSDADLTSESYCVTSDRRVSYLPRRMKGPLTSLPWY